MYCAEFHWLSKTVLRCLPGLLEPEIFKFKFGQLTESCKGKGKLLSGKVLGTWQMNSPAYLMLSLCWLTGAWHLAAMGEQGDSIRSHPWLPGAIKGGPGESGVAPGKRTLIALDLDEPGEIWALFWKASVTAAVIVVVYTRFSDLTAPRAASNRTYI